MEHDLSHQAMDIKANAKTAIDALRPYRDVLLFAATLLVANAVWKMVVSGDEYGRGDVTVFGMVATPLFDIQTRQITDIVYTLLHPIRENLLRIASITLIIEHHPEWFEVMHGWVLKYLFYGIMFIGWVGFTLLRDKKS